MLADGQLKAFGPRDQILAELAKAQQQAQGKQARPQSAKKVVRNEAISDEQGAPVDVDKGAQSEGGKGQGQ